MSAFGCIGADYNTTSGKFERWLVHKLIKFLFGGIPVELDFLEGDIRQLRNEAPTIRIAPPRLWRLILILRNPEYYLPEAFVEGYWFCTKGKLSDLVLHLTNRKGRTTKNSGLTLGINQRFRHAYKQYMRPTTLRETKTHYNSDVRMYRRIVGEDLVYSCAFFDEHAVTLADAQENKLATTLARLDRQLESKHKVLDIGCGWGSFIFYSMKRNNAKYDGISIAQTQIDYASE